jgi:hypothetical protein
MKASLLTAGALVCTATLASAQQHVQAEKQLTPKAAAQLQAKLAAQQHNNPLATPPATGGTSTLAPGSDSCTTPTAIAGPGPFGFDTSIMTTGTQGQANGSCLFFGTMAINNDAWFAWTSGFTGNAILDFCGQTGVDTKAAIYAGSGCPGGAPIACQDDFCGLQSQIVFPVTSATTYTLQIGTFPGAANGTGTFTVTAQPPPAGNDACAGAIAISGPGPHAFNTIGSTTDGPNNCGAFANDVWFNWTAGAGGVYNVDFCTGGVTYDSEVAVYDTSACLGALLACNDDFCGLVSHTSFTAVGGQVYKIQVGGFGGGTGTGSFTIAPPPPPPPNDDCTTPTAIAGPGPFAFDNTSATTGAQGQGEAACLAYATTAVENDEWYTWTAFASGQAQLTTCGQTSVDTKIGVYPGAGCPGAAAIACNDDACGLQSTICWNVTNGSSYTIQLGTFPGATGGAGTFSISIGTGGSACQLDDGSSENMLGWTAGGEMGWLQRFGGVGTTNVNNIQVAWGSAAFPGLSPGNGSPSKVLLYDDPTDDGDPSDVTLVQQVNTTVSNVDTDTLNTYAVTPAVLNGIFFAGAGEIHPSGNYVAVMDQSSCILGDWQYFFGNNNATPVDYGNVSNNAFPPQSFAANGFACNLLVRAGCSSSPMVTGCFPGTSGIINCPCGQPANPSGGCANFGAGATSGAALNATGVASIAADSVVLAATNERPGAILNVFFTGSGSLHLTGVPHGAGVRCVTTALKRLYTGQTSGGTIARPGMGDPSITARCATLSVPISAGQTRHYFNLYRDAQAAGPCGNTASTVNTTNAGSITWAP